VSADDASAEGSALERQLQIVERRYAEARGIADQFRDEWRALSAHPRATPGIAHAARVKFEAVAARCRRLLEVIDDLQARIER
jgi:hypothetical protein